MPRCAHPPRLVYGRNTSRSQQCQTKPYLPPVRGGSQSSRSNALVNTPSSISFTGAKNPPQDRHTDTASTSLREGHPDCTEMSSSGHPLTSFGPPQLRSNANLKTPN
jgi:hypothetical protein